MTTIAYRAGVIASDSRGTMGNTISPAPMRKLFPVVKHGCVLGIAGSYTYAVAFVRIFETLDRAPWYSKQVLDFGSDWVEEFDVFAMNWDGRLFFIENGQFAEVASEFYAIGSGMQAACAAMHMGADACKAVQIASRVDSATDERIVCFGVDELKMPAYLSAPARSPKLRSPKTPARTSRPASRVSRKKPASP